MDAMRRISESVTAHIPEVLRQFNRVIEQEPWISLPADYRTNDLGEVVQLATTLALVDPRDRELCRRMVHLASKHGQGRLEQGLPDTTIFQELYMVRESLWTYMQETNGDHGLAAEAIVRVDMALSLASKASIRGYHRPAFQARGDWPGIIDQLVEEWSPPPPVHELADAMEA